MRGIITTAAACLLILAGCVTGTAIDNATTSAPSSIGTYVEPSPEPVFLNFPAKYEFDGGLVMTVSKPRPVKLKGYHSPKVRHARVFTIQVKNNGNHFYRPKEFMAVMQSGSEDSPEIYDYMSGIEGPPHSVVLAGDKRKWVIGFDVKDPKHMVLEITPDLSRPSIFVTTDPIK